MVCYAQKAVRIISKHAADQYFEIQQRASRALRLEKIPDSSQIMRFCQKYCEHSAAMFEHLVNIYKHRISVERTIQLLKDSFALADKQELQYCYLEIRSVPFWHCSTHRGYSRR